MSLHSRPIPAPKAPVRVAAKQSDTHLMQPEPLPVGQPTEVVPQAEPMPRLESPVQTATPGTSRPWYRSEPWMAVVLASFAPLLATFIAPDAAQYPLIGLSVVALVVGAVMLLRQGVHRPPAGSRSI